MAEKISKLSVFQEHADELSETDFHYDVKTDTYTICSRGFDRKNEKIISVNSLEDLLKRYRKIHIADGDILMINGEKIRIDGIRENAFSTCTALDSLIISDGITIGTCFNTFKGCNELEYLYYSNGGYCGGWNCGDGRGPVTDMTYSGLKCKTLETTLGCCEQPFWRTIGGSLEKLIIRETNRFNSNVDEYCPKLKTIVCYSTTPPFTGHARSPYVYSSAGCYITFESWQWSTITLYVPRESLEKYYFDRVWGEIDNIYAIDEMPTTSTNNTSTSINFITNSVTEDDVWYSLNGTKVDKPTKGVYIKNGKKYVIK
jgi:hypothetical protein